MIEAVTRRQLLDYEDPAAGNLDGFALDTLDPFGDGSVTLISTPAAGRPFPSQKTRPDTCQANACAATATSNVVVIKAPFKSVLIDCLLDEWRGFKMGCKGLHPGIFTNAHDRGPELLRRAGKQF